MLVSALLFAASVSLSRAERDADFDKYPMNTLHDCTGTPEPFGACRLPSGLSAADIETRLAGKRSAWWRQNDELFVVARRNTDQAYLCCSVRARMDHIADDLWTLRLRIVDIDKAIVSIGVQPEPDLPSDVFRGPNAPPKPVSIDKLQGNIHILDLDSRYLGEVRRIFVYTPPGFDPGKIYPVVYMSDGQFRATEAGIVEPLIVKGELPPMLLVAIWCGLKTDDERSQEYLLDWPDGTRQFLKHESFLLKEVLPYVEQNFGATSDPHQRVITGFSSGAAWAVAMGLMHPDIFPNVVAQSLIWRGPMESVAAITPSSGSAILSAGSSGNIHDVYDHLLGRSTQTRFFLSAGTFEPHFYYATLQLAAQARDTGHPVQLTTTVCGHFLTCWDPLLVPSLKWAFGPH
jgi:enterochelin esterase-like enzyme